MRQLTGVLFIAIFIISKTHEYQKKNKFFFLWGKFHFNYGDGKIKRQSIARPTAQAVTAHASQNASTNATLPTPQTSSIKPSQTSSITPSQTSSIKPSQTSSIKPSQTSSIKPSQASSIKPSQTSSTKPLQTPSIKPSQTPSIKPSATLQKPSVTIPNSVPNQRLILQTTTAATVKETQLIVVPTPVDVIPVQTVPPQRFLPSMKPPATTDEQNNIDGNRLNQSHFLLPNLPVYNVGIKPQDVQPVIPVKEVAKQTQIKTEMNPIAPLPIMTRPTVTVLQHVIGGNPTQVTLPSVVVPKRKYASPPPILSPLPVLPLQTAVPPMRPLKPLAPLPPQEPHIIHHIPIVIPTNCGNSHPCGCENDCVGK